MSFLLNISPVLTKWSLPSRGFGPRSSGKWTGLVTVPTMINYDSWLLRELKRKLFMVAKSKQKSKYTNKKKERREASIFTIL